jgi:hypothetical protein
MTKERQKEVCIHYRIDGTPPEEWSISVVLKNVYTGNIVWEGTFPEESFTIGDEDWDV